MGYIYKIENKINHKLYIGITTLTIEKRWKEHLSTVYNSPNKMHAIHHAMKKYGIENFQISMIEEVADDLLFEREKYWISFYNSYGEKGYNLTLGGEGAPKYDKNEFKKLWDKGLSVNEIADYYGCNRNTVMYALQNFDDWLEEVERRNKEQLAGIQEKNKKEIDCYDLQGNYIKTYNSQREASRELGVSESNISAILNGRQKRISNWQFVYSGEAAPPPYVRTGSKAVFQMDLNDNIINEFSSAAEAALKVTGDKTRASSIRAVCANKRRTAYGYKWRWKDDS